MRFMPGYELLGLVDKVVCFYIEFPGYVKKGDWPGEQSLCEFCLATM